MKRPLAVALVLAVLAPLVLLGCGKDNPAKPKVDPQPFVYPDQSTPVNTVRRMAAAFERRDSVVTESVYADDYAGTSIDLTDPSPVTYAFLKSDEVRAVGAMATSDLAFVNFELYTPQSWARISYASDPPQWVTLQIPNFRVEVLDGAGNGYSGGSAGSGESWIFEFTLRPTAPSPTSPTDTTWTIVRWVESRSN